MLYYYSGGIMEHNSFAKTQKTFFLVGIYSVAMGFLEAIVVIYLRLLYYPHGFDFPIQSFPSQMLSVEWLREIATIVMLLIIGLLAGKNHLQKLLYFLYSFGVWDIFYYIGLKLLINWPSSFLTWDILFLIPITWVGPVLAPIICSLTMIVLAESLVCLQEKGCSIKIRNSEWIALLSGAFLIFCTFILDYAKIIIQGGFLSDFWKLAENEIFQQIVSQYKPAYYNWYLFSAGELIILVSLIMIVRRAKKKKNNR